MPLTLVPNELLGVSHQARYFLSAAKCSDSISPFKTKSNQEMTENCIAGGVSASCLLKGGWHPMQCKWHPLGLICTFLFLPWCIRWPTEPSFSTGYQSLCQQARLNTGVNQKGVGSPDEGPCRIGDGLVQESAYNFILRHRPCLQVKIFLIHSKNYICP